MLQELTALAPQLLPYAETCGGCSIKKAPRGQAHSCSRARKARCWMWTTAPTLLTSSNTVAAQAGPAPAWDRVRWLCPGHLKAYTTRVGQDHSRPNRTTRRPQIGERGREFGTIPADAALRLVRRGAGAPDRADCGINGLALTKLDILDGFDSIEVVPATPWTARKSTICRRRGAQARISRSTDYRSWKQPTANAAPGRTCRRRPSIRPSGRGTGGCQSLCFPPARNAKYYSGPEPVRANVTTRKARNIE